jgi:hypothetical protein
MRRPLHDGDRLPDMKQALLKIHVLPAQSQHFSALHAGGEQDRPDRPIRAPRRGGEELLRLRCGPRPHLTELNSWRPDGIGHIARHEAHLDGHAQSLFEPEVA